MGSHGRRLGGVTFPTDRCGPTAVGGAERKYIRTRRSTPAFSRCPMQYKYVVLTNTTIGTFMALLDSNIVLISLPTIIRDLPGTTTIEGIWIILGYVLVTASLLLTIGRLADLYGRVRLYNLGFAIFTIGSGLCSLAPNGTSLVLFRLVQGIGAGLLFANSAAILTDAFPVSERGRALGLNQVAGTGGALIGLVAGGVLTALLGWQSIFWINVPFGVFATIWAYARLKELGARPGREKLDPAGNLLFAGGLSLALLSVGPISGYLSDKYGPRLFTTGGLLVSGVSYLWFAVLPYQVPYTTLVLPMILAGIGGGLFIAPNVASIMNSVPIVRRGVAAGMSATLFNVGFLVSLGLAFAIMASRMPLPVMQAIFAGLPIPQGQVEIGSFMDAFHQIFVAIAGISLFGAIPAAVRRNPVVELPSSEVKA